MQLENAGFARNAWRKLFFDHSSVFEPIAQGALHAVLHGIPVAFYNFPRCTVPPQWRSYARMSISDWKRKYLEECVSCSEQHTCSGFFEWHPADSNYEVFGPI